MQGGVTCPTCPGFSGGATLLPTFNVCPSSAVFMVEFQFVSIPLILERNFGPGLLDTVIIRTS